jgi:glycosyltransferase involved in cell wall biosynthesis
MTADAVHGARPRILLTVSGQIPADVDEQVARGQRPRADYLELAGAMGADLLDVVAARRQSRRLGSVIERFGGVGALLAWTCWRQRRRYDAIVTDGEQVGLPLALLFKLSPRRSCVHVMIAHVMSVPKKMLLFRLGRLGRAIDLVIVYSSWQCDFLIEHLGPDKVCRSHFMVDTRFFVPNTSPPQRMICAAGLELRDYPTLMEAVRGVDVRVVLAAASPWSKRSSNADTPDVPANVEVCKLGFQDLRQLYSDAAIVVVPLQDVDFQAGITTILEAMAMGKPVICTRTRGQTDVVIDGVNGVYVPPASVESLRLAIVDLLDDPDRRARLGEGGRNFVEAECDVTTYADRIADATLGVIAGRTGRLPTGVAQPTR